MRKKIQTLKMFCLVHTGSASTSRLALVCFLFILCFYLAFCGFLSWCRMFEVRVGCERERKRRINSRPGCQSSNNRIEGPILEFYFPSALQKNIGTKRAVFNCASVLDLPLCSSDWSSVAMSGVQQRFVASPYPTAFLT